MRLFCRALAAALLIVALTAACLVLLNRQESTAGGIASGAKQCYVITCWYRGKLVEVPFEAHTPREALSEMALYHDYFPLWIREGLLEHVAGDD